MVLIIKVVVIYGGISTEHDISVKSSQYVLNNLNKEKYSISEIYIDKDGVWYKGLNGQIISNTFEYLRQFDIAFPVLHGLYGEDGTIQGLFELLGIPYIGCKVLSSSICMDKVYTKVIFDRCKIKNAKNIYIRYVNKNKYQFFDDDFNESIYNINDLKKQINRKLRYPLFIKPSNSGSSIGVYKVKNQNKLEEIIEEVSKYDSKILIEQGINGKEVEVAVLGNSKVGIEISRVGEILSAEEFYSYSSKYENKQSRVKIPADITQKQYNQIREMAKKAFLAVDGSGLSRIDFFIEKETGEIYLNEINTLPGLTEISMYPMLMRDFGYSDELLLDKLIETTFIYDHPAFISNRVNFNEVKNV